jgi:eukaryotic-like serine/threonine-protein kinase
LTLNPGTRLGPYEIVAPLGAGGMGEVYRARDTKLDRDVAIKVLPELFVSDPERVARFQREAKTLAALNHPHIGGIYGLEDADGVRALVLELVDGPTLADRIAQGPIPLDEALPIARQIAEALEAAHEQGIIHRDLKPANIKLRPDGTVKVLDFGLAKALEPASAVSPIVTASPTITTPAMMTGIGMILGTAAYMSPEQAKGKLADKRSDIWAFGCVVYEMLTGTRPFDGDDVSDVLATVLKGEPDWSAIPREVPADVTAIIRKCLAKDRRHRIPDISVVRFLLNEPPSAPPAAATVVAASARSSARTGLIAAAIWIVSVAVAGGATWLLTRPTPLKVQPVRFSIVPPPTAPFNVQGFFRNLAISPDGANLVYVAASVSGAAGQLMIRPIDQLDAVPLRGIDNAGFPFVSPDGHWVGFFAGGANGELKKVAITGGPPITLCRFEGVARGASWGADDTIVFATSNVNTGLMSVPAGGGEPKVLTKPDVAHGELDHLFPAWLPDRRRSVLYTVINGSIDTATVAVLDLETGQSTTLIRGGSDAQYVRTGHLVYASAGTLRAVRFDPARRAVLSDPVPVVEQVTMLTTGAADFSISEQGTLAYVTGGPATGAARSLVWVNRQGRQEPIGAPPRTNAIPRLSPDGTRLALDIRDQQNDIWIWEFARKTLTRLTVDPGLDSFPVWTPDGRRIAFASGRAAGVPNLFWQAADGIGAVERLTTSFAPQVPNSFSPDGKTIIFTQVNVKTGSDLMQLHLDGSAKAEPLIQTDFTEAGGEISPDGGWIAYQSNESGQSEVYVRPFPKVDGGRWPISTGGGSWPAWSRNGRELFYVAPNTAMMAVPVQTSPRFSAGNPSKLFDGPRNLVQPSRTYDVSPDGQRFLMIKDPTVGDQNTPSLPINVVVHWTEELKARVPTK